MDDVLTRLPLDLTGQNPENLVRETHALVNHEGISARFFQLDHGGFYTRSLVVYDGEGNQLTKNRDYIATFYYKIPSDYTGLDITGVVGITNVDVIGPVVVTANMVGGDYAINLDAVDTVVGYYQDNPTASVDWKGITGEPTPYPPGGLQDDRWALEGFESFNKNLEFLIRAVLYGDQEAYTDLRLYAHAKMEEFQDELSGLSDLITEHIDDQDNPHGLTKTQIGLALVMNYAFGDDAAGLDGIPEYYADPRHLGLLKDRFDTNFNAHENDPDNPHETTPGQADTYSQAEVDSRAGERLGVTDTAVDSTAFGGRTLIETVRHSQAQLDTAFFTQGRVAPQHMGLGNHNNNAVLRGNGRWDNTESVFGSEVASAGNNILFIGYQGSLNSALGHIRATYSNISEYPVGTVVFFRIDFSHRQGTGNGVSYKNVELLRAAQRRSSGWAIT